VSDGFESGFSEQRVTRPYRHFLDDAMTFDDGIQDDGAAMARVHALSGDTGSAKAIRWLAAGLCGEFTRV